ncbi:MAG TPA: HIT domain-containing protein [Phycisphaerales bacterium]
MPAPSNDPGPRSLHAPWRQQYLESLGPTPNTSETARPKPSSDSASFLLDYWQHPELDERNHVVVRNQHGMVLLNAFPYTGGHLLIALGDPRPTLLDYTADQRAELWKLTDLAAELAQRTLQPQGLNIGINQGRAAGAGVPTHLHVHVVPRWSGDVNFINVVGEVRIISASLDVMAARYRAAWNAMHAS